MSKNRSNKKSPPNPHDAVFKAFFSDEKTACDYLNGYAPASIRQKIDLNHFRKTDSAFVSGRFGVSYSDVLYETRLSSGHPARLLFLFEHKSYQSSAPIHLQLLDYKLQIWEDDLKNKRRLSFVIPVIIYHGQRGWDEKKLSDSFPDLPEEWRKFIPDFHYLLTDLSNMAPQEILSKNESGRLRNLFLALKYVFNKQQVLENWERILTFGRVKPDDTGQMILLQTLTVYLFNYHDMTDAQVKSLSKQLPLPEQEWIDAIPDALTLKWKNKGMREGMKEGMREGMREGLEKGRTEGLEKGRTEGLEKGRAEGLEKGRTEGLEKGRAEGLEKGREESAQIVALKLLREFPNWTDAKIAELSGAKENFVREARLLL